MTIPAFDLEPFELCQRAVEVEDGVAFLQLLSLLLGSRQDHSQVGAVHFEENRVLFALLIDQTLFVHKLVVLVVGVVVLDHDVQNCSWVGDGDLGFFGVGCFDDIVLWK